MRRFSACVRIFPMVIKFLCVVSAMIFLFAGCSGLKKEQAVSSYSFDGKVLDSERLKSGGKIYLIPFSAGVGVEASEALDEASLMLLKGIYEELSSTNSALVVLTSGQGSSADFILRGHFVKWGDSVSTGIKKFLPSGKQRIISVDGEIVERSTGNVLVHFVDSKGAAARSDDHRGMGFEIGKDIGRFILSAVR